jgi:hypothetical protein
MNELIATRIGNNAAKLALPNLAESVAVLAEWAGKDTMG